MLNSINLSICILLSSIVAVTFNGGLSGVYAQTDDQVKFSGLSNKNHSSLNDIYNKTLDSVVQISTEYQDPTFSNNSFGSSGNSPFTMKFGSGFIYDKSGIIITNYHVVSSAINIIVTFSDGDSYTAKVVGVDPYGDISILKVENASGEKFVSVKFANSSNLKVGDPVYAVGSPYGLDNSLTSGIISQINRLLPNFNLEHSIPNVIQTHPNLSPLGNDGGPLFDLEGKVVGMNTAYFAANQTAFGDFGFAVPSNDINRIVPSLIETGEYQHPWLGYSGSKLSPILAEMFGLPPNYKGVLIDDVVPGGPADKAGLKGMLIQGDRFGEQQILDKDIIITVDGKPVSRTDDIISYLDTYKKVGDKVNLTVNRNGQIINLVPTLEARPDLPKLSDLPDSDISDQNSEDQNGVSVIEGSTFTEGNNLYILGEVKNNLNSVLNLVEVSITLYDSIGKIIGTTLTYTNPSTIQPLGSAPFKLSIGPSDVTDINAIDNWKIVVSYR